MLASAIKAASALVIQDPGAPPFHCYLGTLEKYEDGWVAKDPGDPRPPDDVTSTHTKLRDLVAVDKEEHPYDTLKFDRSGEALDPDRALIRKKVPAFVGLASLSFPLVVDRVAPSGFSWIPLRYWVILGSRGKRKKVELHFFLQLTPIR